MCYRDLAHPSPNFHRGQKVRNLGLFKTLLNFEQPAFENAAKYPKLKLNCNAAMSYVPAMSPYVLAKFGEV